jgi:hypothetical protein
MAAGLGFKTFATGDVLSAGDVNGYLMQGILVFASAAARDSAITSPQEGQFAYLKDTNITTYYTGSAWANVDSTGMTNPMTTTGDTIYSSSGSTPARLGIGTTGQILTVSGGVPTWAAPAGGGGLTLLSTTTLSGATTTISSISQDYKFLTAYILGVTNDTANGQFTVKPNNASLVSSGFKTSTASFSNASPSQIKLCGDTAGFLPVRTVDQNAWTLQIDNYASTTQRKPFQAYGAFECTDFEPNEFGFTTFGFINTTSAITSLVFANAGGNLAGGTVLLYGGN